MGTGAKLYMVPGVDWAGLERAAAEREAQATEFGRARAAHSRGLAIWPRMRSALCDVPLVLAHEELALASIRAAGTAAQLEEAWFAADGPLRNSYGRVPPVCASAHERLESAWRARVLQLLGWAPEPMPDGGVYLATTASLQDRLHNREAHQRTHDELTGRRREAPVLQNECGPAAAAGEGKKS